MGEIPFVPLTYTQVSGDHVALLEKFLNMLDDLKDVQAVYHNVENV